MQPSTILAWLPAALFYGFQFILRVSPGVISKELMSSLNIDATLFGTLASFYYMGYSAMQIPSGLLIDRVGPKRPLLIALTLCALGCVVFSQGTTVDMLCFGRLLIGIGSAFAFVSCITIASYTFSSHLLPLFVGLTMLLGTTGATAGGYPLSKAVSLFGWQTSMLALGIMCLSLTTLVWFFVKDQTHLKTQKKKTKDTVQCIMDTVRQILVNPQTWWFGLYGFLMYIPLSGFADLWGAPYIAKAYNVDTPTAAGAVSIFYVGIGAGTPLWALIISYLKSYRKCMAWGAAGCALVYSALIYGDFPFNMLYPLFLTAGLFSAVQFHAFAGVAEINPKERTATAVGMHNMLCMLSGVLVQPLIGKLLDLYWDGSMAHNAPDYTLENFHFALGLLPLSLIGSFVIVAFIKEAYPQDRVWAHAKA